MVWKLMNKKLDATLVVDKFCCRMYVRRVVRSVVIKKMNYDEKKEEGSRLVKELHLATTKKLSSKL